MTKQDFLGMVPLQRWFPSCFSLLSIEMRHVKLLLLEIKLKSGKEKGPKMMGVFASRISRAGSIESVHEIFEFIT